MIDRWASCQESKSFTSVSVVLYDKQGQVNISNLVLLFLGFKTFLEEQMYDDAHVSHISHAPQCTNCDKNKNDYQYNSYT